MKKIIALTALAGTLFSCSQAPKTPTVNPDIIPAAAGFNLADSDAEAIAIADSVAIAMGGKRALDTARFIEFNFFGARSLFVDRLEKKVRIASNRTDFKVVCDMEKDIGKVFIYGEEQTHPDSIKKFMDVAQAMEINDVYWLLFPFKLKDSGVTLKYNGKAATADSTDCHVLQLTFNEVGETPDNKYLAYVNPETYMVEQWDFYRNATDSLPSIVSPYENYQDFNGIKISLDRGPYKFSDVAVYSTLSDSLYKATFETL